MTWKWITHFKIQQSLFDSWLQFSGNTSISHIHLKHVATRIGDLETQFLHLQFPIFKVLFIFMINLEKTLWCAKDSSPFFFFLLFFNSSLIFFSFSLSQDANIYLLQGHLSSLMKPTPVSLPVKPYLNANINHYTSAKGENSCKHWNAKASVLHS